MQGWGKLGYVDVRINGVTQPRLSIVVPVWDRLSLVRDCVASIRSATDGTYELVLVDNGSGDRCASFLAENADVLVRHEHNLGYAGGINSSLTRVQGDYVALVNSDTVLPPGWAGTLLAHLDDPTVGAVVPALTAAAVPRTVRQTKGTRVEVLLPFEQPPSGAVIVLRRQQLITMGGMCADYGLAGAEDLDLAFTLWTNDLDLVFDSRVLVQHVSKGTAAVKMPDWPKRWQDAGHLFLARWSNPHHEVAHLDTCDRERFDRNRRTAAAVARWMQAYVTSRRDPLSRVANRLRAVPALGRALRLTRT